MHFNLQDYTDLRVIRSNFIVYETMRTKTEKKLKPRFLGKTDPKPNRLRNSRTVTTLTTLKLMVIHLQLSLLIRPIQSKNNINF